MEAISVVNILYVEVVANAAIGHFGSLVCGNSEQGDNRSLEIILNSVIVVLVLMKQMIRLFFGNVISEVVWNIWILIELVIVQILCTIRIKNWSLNLCGFLLCIGSSGTFKIWPKVRQYLILACLNLTEKERVSRQSGRNQDPRFNLGTSMRLKNFMNFFCNRKIPRSQV